MKPFTALPSLLFSFGIALAAAAVAQDRPPGPPDGHHPHPDPKVEAALDDCWNELGGEEDDPVPPDLMAQCMDEKGFKRPVGPPPGPEGAPPPPPPPPAS